MKKVSVYQKIALIIFVIFYTLSLCYCSYPVDKTGESGESDSLTGTPKNELAQALEMAAVYNQFVQRGEDVSDQFCEATANSRKIFENAYSSEQSVAEATGNLLNAVNTFHEHYFVSGNEKFKDAELIQTLWVGDVKCAYDTASRVFFYTMGTTAQNNFEFDFRILSGFDKPVSDGYSQGVKVSVFAEIIDAEGIAQPYRFVPELNKAYTLRAYSDKYTFDYKIMFTMLPIIEISGIRRIDDVYKDCTIYLTDPDFAQIQGIASPLFIESSAKIHIRGGISRSFPKKAYSIKFVDNAGENKDMSLFSMRSDSDWILDAMYIDRARARNRVSTDIWHEMRSPLYYESESDESAELSQNGTDGVFVEMFMNNEYIGLYCFTEKIDRQQLQLMKNNGTEDDFKSVIYKGKAWGPALLFKGLPDYYNGSSWWDAFEQKFPNPSLGGEIRWEPLYNFVKFFLESSDEEFASNIDKYIDIQNFIEYTILMCISYAYDNTGKNAYWSVYDITDENLSKLFITPWDLDSTWGRSWNGSRVESSTEWMDSDPEHDTALFRRLVLTNAGGFADKLKQRWSELKDNVLSVNSIVQKFSNYFELFDASGAWERESMKWEESRLNMDTEIEYISEWTQERWAYIDNIIMNELDTVDKFAPRRRWGR